MLIQKLIDKMKEHPDMARMGMIATHLGLVRETSIDRRKVREMEVAFDMECIDEIAHDIKNLPGIVEVLIECNPGRLSVGQEVMAVAVGGDTREHVFPALIQAVDRIKKEATSKREIFAE